LIKRENANLGLGGEEELWGRGEKKKGGLRLLRYLQ